MIKKIKPLIICLAGTMLEWYDFSIFSAFSPIMAELFFPSKSHMISLLKMFITLSIGFLVRPIGAAYFGNLGDKSGRKISLFITIILMTLSTTLVGLLPTYRQAGAIAPVLLLVLRFLQGLAVSGEHAGGITFLSELAEPYQKAFLTSFAIVGIAGGMALGYFASLLLSCSLSHTDLLNWGWRLPFISGIALGGIGLCVRSKLAESSEFIVMTLQKKESHACPFLSLLKYKVIDVLKTIGISCGNIIAFYTVFVYMPANLAVSERVSLNFILAINAFSLMIMMIFVPIFGYLSDKLGKIRILNTGAMALIFFAFPLFSLYHHSSVVFILFTQVSFSLLVAWYVGAIPAIVSGLFSTELRYSGVAMSVNLVASLFGGTTPIIAAYLFNTTNNNFLVCGYLVGGVITSLIASYYVKIR